MKKLIAGLALALLIASPVAARPASETITVSGTVATVSTSETPQSGTVAYVRVICAAWGSYIRVDESTNTADLSPVPVGSGVCSAELGYFAKAIQPERLDGFGRWVILAETTFTA